MNGNKLISFIKNNARELSIIFIVFIISRILFIISLYIGLYHLPNKGTYDINNILEIFYKWNDASGYIDIAKNGYSVNFAYYAFAPLYPLSIKFFSFIFLGSYEFAGFFVTNISFIIFIILFYYYISFYISKEASMYAVIALIIYPASNYNTILYTESLFFLNVIISLIAYRNKDYMVSALFCGLSTLTRITGLALLVGYGIDMLITYIKTKNFSIKSALILLKDGLSFLAIVLAVYGMWLVFMYAKEGNPFYFFESQKVWSRETPNPFIIPFVIKLFISIFQYPALRTFLEFLLPMVMIIFSILSIKKMPICFTVYSIFTIIMPLTTSSTWSLTRLPMVALASYTFIGIKSEKNKVFKIIYFLISFTLYMIFSGTMGQLRGTYI